MLHTVSALWQSELLPGVIKFLVTGRENRIETDVVLFGGGDRFSRKGSGEPRRGDDSENPDVDFLHGSAEV